MECLQLYNVHHNVEIVYNMAQALSLFWEKYTMSTGTKVFINCLQHKHSLCFGRNAQCPQEKKFLSIASSSSLFVDSSLLAVAAANSSSVYSGSYYTGNQNRNFLQLQNHYPMMT